MDTNEIARALYASTVVADGATLAVGGYAPVEGYLVALTDLTESHREPITPATIADYITANLEVLREMGYYVRVTSAPGVTTLDVVANMATRSGAEWFAGMARQLEYFDVLRDRAIRV